MQRREPDDGGMEGAKGLRLKWNELKLTAVLMPSQQPKSQYVSTVKTQPD